jgi:SNF2 family DNA or RNA helicase
MTSVSSVLKSVLLLAPVNTLSNWCDEFFDWRAGIHVYKLSSEVPPSERLISIQRWKARGGVLLLPPILFLGLGDLQPDLVILDEAHTMLKNNSSKVYNALLEIKTPRRVGTLGIMNSLKESQFLTNSFPLWSEQL